MEVKEINSENTISRLRILITAIAVIPMVFYLIINNLMISSSLINVEKKIVDEKLVSVKEHFEIRGIYLDNITDFYAGRYDIVSYINGSNSNINWFREKIQIPVSKYYNVQLILLMDKNGKIVDSAGLMNDFTINDLINTSFSQMINGEMSYKSDLWNRLAAYENELYRISSRPIMDSTGYVHGYILLGVKITSQHIQEIEKEFGWKLFININNNIISGDLSLNTNKYLGLVFENNSDIIMEQKKIVGRKPLKDAQGKEVATLYAVVPRDIFPDTNVLIYRNGLIVLALTILLFVFLGHRLKKNIIIPINDLDKQIVKMAENSMLEYVNITGPDEINRLANSFNRMAQNLNVQRMENELLRAELENDKIKTEFLANISHELRTPLNVILGIIQLYELNNRNKISEGVKVTERYGKVIRQNCYRLLRMVNNLIDITKINSHTFRIHLKNNDIVEIVENIVEAADEYISGKGINILLSNRLNEKIIACDAEQIERMLLNLLSNAVKFMPDGGIIKIKIKEENEVVSISISDNGVGIPEDQLSDIFDKFKQVDKSFTRSHEGSGIGLSLVKSIVDLHQGEISVKSRMNEGSEFVVKLPARILSEVSNNLDTENKEKNYLEKVHIEFSDIYI